MNDQLRVKSVTGVDFSLPIAGPGGRSYAFIVDWHIRLILALAWFFIGHFLFTGSFQPGSAGAGSGLAYFYIVALPALLIYGLYHPVLELAMSGRTPGKRMAGIRIVTAEGNLPGVGAILIRNIFRVVDSLPSLYMIGLIACIVTQRHVRIGDMAAGTLLVYEEDKQSFLEDLESLTHSARLSTSQAEIVQDLLGRWKQLNPETRRKMAREILHKLNVPPADRDDAQLYTELESLLRS